MASPHKKPLQPQNRLQAQDNDSPASAHNQRVLWLKQVSLFKNISDNDLAMERIASIMDLQKFDIGSAILEEGSQGLDAYFLLEGQVKVQRAISDGESFPVAILDAKDHPFFGEASLLANDKRSATIIAEKACTCLVFHTHVFEKFAAEHPAWALPIVMNISRALIERLHRSNKDIVLLYNALVNEVRGWQT